MPPRYIANTPVKVNTAFSSPTSVAVAPLTTSIAGLSSVRNIFGTAPARRHTVGQMPSTHFSPRFPINPPPASAGHHHHHHRNQPSVSSFISAGGAMIGIDSGPRKTAGEKAAERDWQEQARQIFQLSTVSAKGHFLPPSPSPLELGKQGSNDRFKDNDTDYFTTIIISTSPERVRTFLSTESSISPGMFSLPANKTKRNAIPSFSTPPSSSSLLSSSASLSSPSSSESSSTRPSSPASMSQQRHLPQQQQTPAVVVGQDKENSKVAATPSNLPPPYVSAVAIPAAIPKRRVVAPADTLSTPPSSPPAISAKDMYFPTSDPTATPTAATQSIPVTPPNSTPKSMPSTPSSQSYNSNSSNNPRQRLRRPHQESPMHRNSRVAEEEQDEDEVDGGGRGEGRGGRGSNRNKVMSKRQAQISFLTGVTSEDEEDLSDIFAHTVYNTNSNNSSSRRRHYGSSSFLTSSPPA